MEGLSQETLAAVGVAATLAGPILRQGSRIDKRFDLIDKRFNLIDRRLERIQERLTSVGKETLRIVGLIEGPGLSGRTKSAPSGDAG